jgi:uncharacterized protein YaiI (UPF0178 family)
MTTIYVDADACPVKPEAYKVAKRYGLPVCVVANQHMTVPDRDDVRLVVVPGGFNAADDWIAENAHAGDIVITADIPLADRSIKAGAAVLTPRGRRLTEDSICDALATRDLMDELRAAGSVTSGPPPFQDRDRSTFLSRLDETVHAVRKLHKLRQSQSVLDEGAPDPRAAE